MLCLGGGTPHKPAVLGSTGHVLHESTVCADYLVGRVMFWPSPWPLCSNPNIVRNAFGVVHQGFTVSAADRQYKAVVSRRLGNQGCTLDAADSLCTCIVGRAGS